MIQMVGCIYVRICMDVCMYVCVCMYVLWVFRECAKLEPARGYYVCRYMWYGRTEWVGISADDSLVKDSSVFSSL